MTISSFAVASAIALFGLPASAQIAGTPSDAILPGRMKISTVPYSTPQGASRELVLWREELARLSGARLLDYFRLNPDRTSFPNLAFILSAPDSANQSGRKVIWIGYAYQNNHILPRQTWSADIAMQVGADFAYVVLAKSSGWSVDLEVFRVALDGNLGPFPLRLDPLESAAWPPSDRPISRLQQVFQERDVSGVSAVQASVESSVLVIRARREHESSPAAIFRLDTNTRKWAAPSFEQVATTPKPDEPRR